MIIIKREELENFKCHTILKKYIDRYLLKQDNSITNISVSYFLACSIQHIAEMTTGRQKEYEEVLFALFPFYAHFGYPIGLKDYFYENGTEQYIFSQGKSILMHGKDGNKIFYTDNLLRLALVFFREKTNG